MSHHQKALRSHFPPQITMSEAAADSRRTATVVSRATNRVSPSAVIDSGNSVMSSDSKSSDIEPSSMTATGVVEVAKDTGVEAVGLEEFQKVASEDTVVVSHSNGKLARGDHVDLKKKDHEDDEEQVCLGTGSKFKSMLRLQNISPSWVLFWLCWAGFLQGFIVNGMVNVVITTIEKRYQMRSTESGLIAGGYDVASFFFLIPVSYFGGTRSKPKFIGAGVLVLALGALVFSSPYFFSGRYEFSLEEEQLCPRNATICKTDGLIKTSLNNYKYLFFLGQFIHGAGAAPFYTLGCAYIEESVSTRSSSLYLGIFYTMALVGPAIGYVVGGQFLGLYVDWVHVDEIGLNSLSSIWVGCWWIGFLVGALVALFVAFPIMAFPRVLPGSEAIKAQKVSELHKSSQHSEATKENFGRTLSDLPKSIKILITNPTFMFLNLSGAMEGLLLSGLGTFLPKVLEQQFGLTSTKAALLMGLVTLPGGGGGTFLGGYLVKRFDLKCAGIIKMCVASSIVALLLGTSFFISCPTRKFAGVTHFPEQYKSSQQASGFDSMSCNSQCSCSKYQYDPICGKDNVIYFSACHAGCGKMTLLGDTTVYSDCSCLANTNQSESFSLNELDGLAAARGSDSLNVDAIRQTCTNNCNKLPWFLFFVFLSMLFTFLVSMPSLSATLRCVAESQKSFALGIQWLGVRALGTIPAPFILGSFIDKSCVLWQTSCESSDTGACLLYDNQRLSTYMVLICMTVKMISLVSFILAGLFYKPPDLDEEKAATEDASSRL